MTKTVIDVSCVEQGRWAYHEEIFSSGGMVMRSLKETVVSDSSVYLREEGRARSDQGQAWDRISERAEELDVDSPTDSQRDILKEKADSIGDFKKHFHPVPNQVGLIVLFNENVAGLEVFPDNEAFKQIFDPLLDSYIIDAMDLSPMEIDNKAKPAWLEQSLRSHPRT